MNNWLNAHPSIKNILLISAKNAINAILTNASLMAMLHDVFNFSTHSGLWNILKATASVVGSREAIIWVPKIIKWSQSNGTP